MAEQGSLTLTDTSGETKGDSHFISTDAVGLTVQFPGPDTLVLRDKNNVAWRIGVTTEGELFVQPQ